jgi:asparagine synthase (glutamine-hydrolysing)
MCGIFGAINFKDSFSSSDLDKFISLTDKVSYRGPDASGYLNYNSSTNEINKSRFNLFFGHRRLSIIDLSADGDQPLKSDDCYIIFNGEIFNYVELKQELLKDGIVCKTETDTEVIIKIYKKYGTSGFSKLNGMWAFAIYDINKKQVVLSRDRFSLKPLFYLQQDNCFFFASEIKQLLPILKSVNIDQQKIFYLFKQGILDDDENTFILRINRLKAKHNLIISLKEKSIKEEKYWDYYEQDISFNDVEEHFRELLTDSIRIRLRSDVKVGTLLSGGLDSSVISIIAQQLNGKEVNTFSVVSKNFKNSEEKFVDILITEKGILNQKLFITPDEVLKNINAVITAQDEPFSTFSVVAQYTMLKKIRENSNITVVLSGQGGDEVLMGYLKYYYLYLSKHYTNHQYLQILNEISRSIIAGTFLKNQKLSLAKRYIPFLNKRDQSYLMVKYPLKNVIKFSSLEECQKNDLDIYSIPQLSRFEDRNSMANSIETRHPFIDHRLVNFAINLPVNYKIKDGWNKYILRSSFNELPHKIRWRKDKTGFTIPEEKWLKNDLKEIIFNTIQNSLLDELGLLDKKKLRSYYNSFLKGNPLINYSDISRFYITEQWLKKILKADYA